jgi:hypothetical protein
MVGRCANIVLIAVAALCLLTVLSTAESIPGYETTYEVVKPGSGATVGKGATVTVHATVRPRSNAVSAST